MADIIQPDLLPGIDGNVVQTRLVDMGDGTFAPMTVTTLAESTNSIGTVDLGALNGAATAANQTLTNVALATLSSPLAAATTTPLAATVADTGAHVLGPFSPQLTRPMCLTVCATTAASGTLQLLRSIDGGATKLGLTIGGQPWATYTFSGAIQAVVNEQVWTPVSALETFYIAVTLSAGTVTINLHQ